MGGGRNLFESRYRLGVDTAAQPAYNGSPAAQHAPDATAAAITGRYQMVLAVDGDNFAVQGVRTAGVTSKAATSQLRTCTHVPSLRDGVKKSYNSVVYIFGKIIFLLYTHKLTKSYFS